MKKQKRQLQWLRLDNAAKIYPAARREKWSNVFRLSATLTEQVDKAALEKALTITVSRFPSIAARLRKGIFWYYLQQLDRPPEIREEYSYPLTRMSRREVRKCALRVIVYENRIAVELFHSLTDGTGAMIFLKTLLAEYVQQKYGVTVPNEKGVLDRREKPKKEELEDSFLKYAGNLNLSRRSRDAWKITGTPETGEFLHLSCFSMPADQLLQQAHSRGVSLTVFLTSLLMLAAQNLQAKRLPFVWMRKPIKIQVPINLRRMFPSNTLRNFALYATPEILPRLGEYSLDEICQVVHHCMGIENTPKFMSMMIAANVSSEKMLAVRLMPLFIKNAIMKAAFYFVGERKSCLSLSNLGAVEVPEELAKYIKRMDFILGTQSTAPYNCGVLSWNGRLYINFIRNIQEPVLEQEFYRVLRQLDIPVLVESNLPAQKGE